MVQIIVIPRYVKHILCCFGIPGFRVDYIAIQGSHFLVHLKLVCAVNDSIENHDGECQKHKNHHLSWQSVSLQLLWKVVVHSGHHQVVEKESVRDDHNLDRCYEHVQIFARLLLSNQRKQPVEKASIIEDAKHSLIPCLLDHVIIVVLGEVVVFRLWVMLQLYVFRFLRLLDDS